MRPDDTATAVPGRRSAARLLPVLCGALLLVGAAAAVLGPVAVPLGRVLDLVLARLGLAAAGTEVPSALETIFWDIRLPRVVLGGLCGAALSLAGATLQGLFRNPMADPYIVGVSSGASLGAAIGLMSGLVFTAGAAGPWLVPGLAFVGAMVSILAVYMLARSGGRVPVVTLLLAGVAVGSFLSAIVSLLLVIRHEHMDRVIFWMMGGLGSSTWAKVSLCLPYIVIGTAYICLRARDLNLMLLGDEPATGLGVNVERTRRLLLAAASLVTAAAVSVSGTIGFVGLIVPHVTRLLVGPDHRLLLPASALAGAVLLIAADTVARLAAAPAEIPVGIVTALIGVPFFLYLLRQRKASLH